MADYLATVLPLTPLALYELQKSIGIQDRNPLSGLPGSFLRLFLPFTCLLPFQSALFTPTGSAHPFEIPLSCNVKMLNDVRA